MMIQDDKQNSDAHLGAGSLKNVIVEKVNGADLPTDNEQLAVANLFMGSLKGNNWDVMRSLFKPEVTCTFLAKVCFLAWQAVLIQL
jgi:hypothetical protein